MNRFTNFTPQQYVESFVETPTMDFPFQEAMMIEGIKEKRNNELASTLGELSAGDPQAGHLTKDLRNQYMADKEKAIQGLQATMYDPNIPFTTKRQELMKEASRLKNDPRLRTIQEDFELSPHITKGMFEDGYGTSRFYAGLNPQTIKDVTEGKITSINPSTYDGIVDPGKMAAMKPTLEMVIADKFSDYTSSQDADGKMSLKNASGSLDMNTFEKRITPFVNAMINEDGSIKMSEGMTPDMKMFIKAQSYRFAKEGKEYKGQDLLTDIKDVASLMVHMDTTTATTEKDGSTSTSGKDEEGIGGFYTSGDKITDKYTPPEVDNKIETVSAAKKTTGIIQEGTDHYVQFKDDKGAIVKYNMNNVTSSDDNLRKQAASELKNAVYQREKEAYMTNVVEKEHRGVKVLLKNGQPITQEQINTDIINNSNDRYIQSLKYAKALHETEIELLSKGISPKDLEHKYTPKEDAIVKNWKPTSQANKMGYLTLQEKYAINQKCKDCEFTIDGNTLVPTRIFEKHKKYNGILDKKIQESFANTEISTKGIVLINKQPWNNVSDIPKTHQRLRDGINSMVSSQSSGFSGNGKNYEGFWEEDGNKGEHITSLKVSGTDTFENFTGGSFTADRVTWDPTTRNGTNGRWIARGAFYGTKKDGDKHTDIVSEPIDLDVTQYMRDNILTSGENQSVLVTDMALDIVSNTPKGLGGVAPTGLTPEEEKKYGEIYVNRNLDDTYSIYGNTISNGKIVSIETPEFIKKLGEEYGITTNKNLNQSTAIDVLGKMIHTRLKDLQKGESTPEQQVYESLPVSKERLPSVQAAFKAIKNNESGGAGFDAMNTGGGADGKTAYGSSTAKKTFGKTFAEHTLGEVKKLQADGKLHAAGDFQMIPSTLKSVTDKLGLSDSEFFNGETQAKMGNFLFEETVKNAAEDIMKDYGYNLTTTELFNRLFHKGKTFEDSKKPTGWMVHQWRGLENASGEEKQAILTAAVQYLKEIGYSI
jgi:hypothetical protein